MALNSATPLAPLAPILNVGSAEFFVSATNQPVYVASVPTSSS